MQLTASRHDLARTTGSGDRDLCEGKVARAAAHTLGGLEAGGCSGGGEGHGLRWLSYLLQAGKPAYHTVRGRKRRSGNLLTTADESACGAGERLRPKLSTGAFRECGRGGACLRPGRASIACAIAALGLPQFTAAVRAVALGQLLVQIYGSC